MAEWAGVSDEQLILHSIDVVRGDLAQLIQECGLAADPYDWYGGTHYRPGARFDELLVVVSSHRVIVIPDASAPRETWRATSSREHIHISLETADRIEIIASPLTESPKCPNCPYAYDDWPELLSLWYDSNVTEAMCGGCGSLNHIVALDWHKLAGFARSQIRIWGVRQGEVVPRPETLDLLRQRSGIDWDFLFYRL